MMDELQLYLDAGIDPGVELGSLGQVITFPPPEALPPPTPGEIFAEIKAQWAELPDVIEVTPAITGWPAAVAVRPANWDMDLEPAHYQIASGDTLSGLSATYLGDPARFKEIYYLQTDSYRLSHTMDQLYPGEWIAMPDEARDNLLNWLKQGKPVALKPGELPPETIAQKGRRLVPWILGITAVAGVGTIGYLALR